jgi:hypothetical protein
VSTCISTIGVSGPGPKLVEEAFGIESKAPGSKLGWKEVEDVKADGYVEDDEYDECGIASLEKSSEICTSRESWQSVKTERTRTKKVR